MEGEGMTNRYWNFQFEIDKWLGKKELELTSASTRGLWIELLLHMKRENGNGTLRLDDIDFCRLCRCEMEDVDKFINDAKKYKFCDIDIAVTEDSNRVVTIISRRLLREHLDKENNRLKVARHRRKKASNPDVTNGSNPPVIDIINNQVINNQKHKHFFETFWNAYPKKKSKGKAEIAFKKINPGEQLLATMIAKIGQAMKSDDWIKDGGQFIPYPATWLNAKGWEDEIKTRVQQLDNTFYCKECDKVKTAMSRAPNICIDCFNLKPEWRLP
jgi:hypothetical protein